MAKQRMTRKSATVVIAESASTWDPLDWWRLEGNAWAGTKGVALAYAQIAPPSTLHAMRPPGTPPFLRILTAVWILITFVGGIVLHLFGLALIAGPLLRGDGESWNSAGADSASVQPRFSSRSIFCSTPVIRTMAAGRASSPSSTSSQRYLPHRDCGSSGDGDADLRLDRWCRRRLRTGHGSRLLVRIRARRPESTADPDPASRLGCGGDPARVRARVLAEIHAGIEILARRELISAAEAEKAKAAEAGHLALSLAPGSARNTSDR